MTGTRWWPDLTRVSARRALRRADRTGIPRPALERLEDRLVPAVFTVLNNFGQDVSGSLIACILQANATPEADEIVFDSSVFGDGPGRTRTITFESAFGESSTALPEITSPLTITGLDTGTITLELAAEVSARFFEVSAATTMVGLRMQGGGPFAGEGYAAGGAILNHADLTLTRCVFLNNSASQGGAIYSSSGHLTLNTCVIENNTATGQGGGIANYAGFEAATASVLTLNGCVIQNNTASGEGGGIANYGSDLRINTSDILNNSAAGSGGGVFTYEAITTVFDSLFQGNDALPNESGGGIRIWGGTALIQRSAFIGNQAAFGGAIFIEVPYQGGQFTQGGGPATVRIVNCTISGNSTTASGNGAALGTTLSGGDLTLSILDSTIAYNTSPFTGGLFLYGFAGDLTATYRNTIFAENSNENVAVVNGSDMHASVVSGGRNLTDEDSPYFNFGGVYPDLLTDDPGLLPLGDHGGPTPTHALMPGSLAIGNGIALAADPGTDQRGQPRPTAGDVDNNPDIGAYQTQGFTFESEGDDQTAPAGVIFATPLRLRVRDGSQPLAGIPVTFTLPPGFTGHFGDGVTSVTVLTDEDGWATSPLVFAGTQPGIFVARGHVPGATVDYVLVVEAGVLHHYEVVAPRRVANGEAFSLLVRPVDVFGNPFPAGLTSPVTFSTTDLDPGVILPPSFDFSQAEPDANGAYEIPGFVLQSPGEQQIRVLEDGPNGRTGVTSLVVSNQPPEITSLDVSPEEIVEGEQVTLTGTFADAGHETHTVTVYWGDGSSDSVVLAPGVFEFTLTHTYRTLRGGGESSFASSSFTGEGSEQYSDYAYLFVVVEDSAGQTAFDYAFVTVRNDEPTLEVGDGQAQFANEGVEFVRPGRFLDGGDSDFVLTVDYGDGTGVQRVNFDPEDHTFVLRHVYADEGTYTVIVTIDDGRGGHDEASFDVDVLLPGVPAPDADRTEVPPGGTGTASKPGVTATLVRARGGTEEAAIIVAVVPDPVATALARKFLVSEGLEVVAAYDVRAVRVGMDDVAIVTFSYTARGDTLPTLTFLDEDGVQKSVSAGLYVVNTANHTITLRLDRFSTPELRETGGTVFTISAPVFVPVPPQPPAASPSTNVLFVPPQTRTAVTSLPSAAAESAVSLAALLAGFLVGPAEAGVHGLETSGAAPEDENEPEQQKQNEEQTPQPPANGPAEGAGVLQRLPKVAQGAVDLQGVPLTTGSAEPPVLDEPPAPPSMEEEQGEETGLPGKETAPPGPGPDGDVGHGVSERDALFSAPRLDLDGPVPEAADPEEPGTAAEYALLFAAAALAAVAPVPSRRNGAVNRQDTTGE